MCDWILTLTCISISNCDTEKGTECVSDWLSVWLCRYANGRFYTERLNIMYFFFDDS